MSLVVHFKRGESESHPAYLVFSREIGEDWTWNSEFVVVTRYHGNEIVETILIPWASIDYVIIRPAKKKEKEGNGGVDHG
jgi:hypothetical protein